MRLVKSTLHKKCWLPRYVQYRAPICHLGTCACWSASHLVRQQHCRSKCVCAHERSPAERYDVTDRPHDPHAHLTSYPNGGQNLRKTLRPRRDRTQHHRNRRPTVLHQKGILETWHFHFLRRCQANHWRPVYEMNMLRINVTVCAHSDWSAMNSVVYLLTKWSSLSEQQRLPSPVT